MCKVHRLYINRIVPYSSTDFVYTYSEEMFSHTYLSC